jgi:hypothetical protein
MNAAYLNEIRAAGAAAITHIGLTDNGVELAGGSPAYARQPVTWATPSDGLMRPNADLDFNIPGGATVDGWQGYSAATGGTAYGVVPLTAESYAGQGTYKLLAASTGVNHQAS